MAASGKHGRIRVAVLGTRGFPLIQGGVERHCECLYPHLADDFDITVFRRRPFVHDHAKTGPGGIRFIDLPSTRIKGFEALLHSFLATMACLFMRPDVAHIHNIGPAVFAPILRLFRIPVVLTFHSANYEHAKWTPLERKFLRLSERLAFFAARSILFVNPAQYERQPPNIKAKSLYVPNGVDAPSPKAATAPLPSVEGLPERGFILAVGRITPEKGLEDLLAAMQRLPPPLRETPIVIAGGVETEYAYFHRLQELAAGLRITFTGALPAKDVQPLYARARLFVLPSHNEGFPMVLLEAMSYGLDAVVADLPATRAAPLPAEDYVPVADPEALAAALLRKLSASPRKRQYDLTPFNWNLVAAKIANVYRSLASR